MLKRTPAQKQVREPPTAEAQDLRALHPALGSRPCLEQAAYAHALRSTYRPARQTRSERYLVLLDA
jgi:hypothetical protein